jgi:molybdate transport system substrate-binding protein
MRRAGGGIGVVIGLVLIVVACRSTAPVASPTGAPPSQAANPSPGAAPYDLVILAAASLTNALDEIQPAYEATAPEAHLVIATDSSAALRTQIEAGSPADVFLSADTSNPDRLAEEDLTVGDPVNYAGNTLALIVPADNSAGIASPADLANNGVQIVAAGDEVPITAYTVQLLENLAVLPGYPADFADRYAANVVTHEDNVRGIVTKIEEGVGDAGFVYQTDALGSDFAVAIDIPADANVRAVYAGVVISGTDHHGEAQAFLDWLAGPEGQAILVDHGFVAP